MMTINMVHEYTNCALCVSNSKTNTNRNTFYTQARLQLKSVHFSIREIIELQRPIFFELSEMALTYKNIHFMEIFTCWIFRLTQEDAPFVIIDKNESLPLEKRFTGFCIDILQKLASPEHMNFNYTISIEDGTGGVNENTSRWSGIIGALIDQVAL